MNSQEKNKVVIWSKRNRIWGSTEEPNGLQSITELMLKLGNWCYLPNMKENSE